MMAGGDVRDPPSEPGAARPAARRLAAHPRGLALSRQRSRLSPPGRTDRLPRHRCRAVRVECLQTGSRVRIRRVHERTPSRRLPMGVGRVAETRWPEVRRPRFDWTSPPTEACMLTGRDGERVDDGEHRRPGRSPAQDAHARAQADVARAVSARSRRGSAAAI